MSLDDNSLRLSTYFRRMYIVSGKLKKLLDEFNQDVESGNVRGATIRGLVEAWTEAWETSVDFCAIMKAIEDDSGRS